VSGAAAGPGAGRAGRDLAFMDLALALGRRGLGRVWPNPAVGCVLVRPGAGSGGRVVGRGWTQPGGRPHAETEALARAGDGARGATAYVSFEPCSHHGRTPPCTDALIAAGIARAVVAMEDPDPRVSGQGIAGLRRAGIEVSVGAAAAEARAVNQGFLSRIRLGRPMVTLKLASTVDGRIATHTGESRWITGPAARARAHELRARHDGIMVGVTTALSDDPLLTCRLPGMEDRSPVRIVVDSRLRLPLTAGLVATAARTPTWLITLPGNPSARLQAFRDAGVEVIEAPESETGIVDLARAMALLGDRGLTRVLAEGGSRLAASLLLADCVDRLEWFRAPALMGGDGQPAVEAFGVDRLDRLAGFVRLAEHRVGPDLWERYERPAVPDPL
jgi:diaminohydroxyphosphoribosylaminopyrimidine deaminase/5-amino-6-(5-phosphoribosylamino)uracil reductase